MPPGPAPAGTMRSALVTFRSLRSSIIAHNCIHGLAVPSGASGSTTKLLTMFERPIKAHVIRDWIAAHPRIVVPILVFLLGSLTYTVSFLGFRMFQCVTIFCRYLIPSEPSWSKGDSLAGLISRVNLSYVARAYKLTARIHRFLVDPVDPREDNTELFFCA